MAGDDGLEAVDQLIEGRKSIFFGRVTRTCRPEVPVGVLAQLLPPLVEPIERLEEGDRVGDVDRDRHAQLASGTPQGVQPGIVDGNKTPSRVARPQPEQLPDLEPDSTRGDTLPQPGRLAVTEVHVGRPGVVVEATEHCDAPWQGRLPAVQLLSKPVTVPAVEIDDPRDTCLVQHPTELLRGPIRPRPGERGQTEMVVRVDGREPWPEDLVVGRPEHRPRAIVPKQQRIAAGRGRRPPVRHPLMPVSVMPRTNCRWATTNRMIIGARLTRAPAIISGHLPMNWPLKNASPTVTVYVGRSRR